jgi:predicted transcriptional regulator
MTTQQSKFELLELTATIVAAYVGNHAVPQLEVPALIRQVFTTLSAVSSDVRELPREELRPAVTVKRSISPDYIVCLEDGKKFKSLKRHLRSHYNLSPEEYREKWGLPHDYPMVAPNYAEARSQLAKKMGLGKSRYK